MDELLIAIPESEYESLWQKRRDFVNEKLDELFLEIEHGDDEHRKWLKDKIEEFKLKTKK